MCAVVYPPHRQMGSDSFFPYAVTDSTACIFSPFLPGITLGGALKNVSLMFLEMLFCVWIAGTIYSNFLNEPCEMGIISLRANFTAFYCSDFFFFFWQLLHFKVMAPGLRNPVSFWARWIMNQPWTPFIALSINVSILQRVSDLTSGLSREQRGDLRSPSV